jgi:hypothetical protein
MRKKAEKGMNDIQIGATTTKKRQQNDDQEA